MPINDTDTEDSLLLFAWMAVFSPKMNRWGIVLYYYLCSGFGRTGSFYIPREIVKLVKGMLQLFS